jgi:2-polyprenyl-6-methoxyphenol hydroxylase-like FAD-dependent oxidoreductase
MSLLATDVASINEPIRSVLAPFAETLDGHFQAILAATPDADMRIDALFERPPLATWGRGRVTLLGDAAHPMLPHTGQGAAQSLEDAVALGLSLTGADDIVPALRRYERVRAARTSAFVSRGPRLAAFTTSHSPVISWLRSFIVRRLPMSMMLKAFLAQGGPDPHRGLR